MQLLFLHAGTLGDCVLALHLAAGVRSSWGNPVITFASRSSIARLAERYGMIHRAVPLDGLPKRLWTGDTQEKAIADDFLAGFDRVVSLMGGPADPSAQHLTALGARCVIAIDPRSAAGGPPGHITAQWASQMSHQGFPIHLGNFARVNVGSRDRFARELRGRLGLGDGSVVMIHPGSGGRAKCCPQPALQAVAEEIRRRGFQPAWIIGPDEVERDGMGYRRNLEAGAPVLFEESVENAAELVAGADAYIGQDSGMTHVAALIGLPTVAIFGPTDPNIWRPLGDCVSIAAFPGPDVRSWAASIAEFCVAQTAVARSDVARDQCNRDRPRG
jgi:hypothetical protein